VSDFNTVRAAKEYLIRRILAQADRDGIPLSGVERDMLYFSETGWTLPNMMTVSREFDQNYKQDEYEKKIGQIIRRIHDEREGNGSEKMWDEAVSRLRDEDHYLLVLIDGASNEPSEFSRWGIVKLILAGAVVVALLFPMLGFIDSHIANRALARLVDEIALLALVILVVFIANRRHRRSA
jgi:hypothetical protein